MTNENRQDECAVRPTTPEGWAALLPTEEPPDTGPKKLRPGQVYAHGYKNMGYMIGEVGPRTTGPKQWVNGMLVNPEGYSFKRLAGNYTDALTFVTDECFVSRKFVLLFDAPEAAESAKRVPVVPWVRLEVTGKYRGNLHWCLYCPRPADANEAAYAEPTGNGACEACAERAGVLGPVNTYTPVGTAVASPEHVMTFLDETVKIWDMPVEMVELPPDPPTCAGPLATHGTPVLRWRRELFGDESKLLMLCDACHLECEQMLANRMRIAEAGRGARSTEPPARIGTVPQVVSVGVGIWAARGMRR